MRVAIIDDHPVVRGGVRQMLSLESDIQVVGTAASVQEGLELLTAERPDIAMVDLRMPGGGGLELIRRARQVVPECRFIILTAYASQGEVAQAAREDISGYILKEALPEEMISALRLVAQGRRYYDPAIIDTIMGREESNLLRDLTRREMDILYCLVEGQGNSDIADSLHISENTVRRHVSNILAKLQVKNRVQAAHYAISRGISDDLNSRGPDSGPAES